MAQELIDAIKKGQLVVLEITPKYYSTWDYSKQWSYLSRNMNRESITKLSSWKMSRIMRYKNMVCTPMKSTWTIFRDKYYYPS